MASSSSGRWCLVGTFEIDKSLLEKNPHASVYYVVEKTPHCTIREKCKKYKELKEPMYNKRDICYTLKDDGTKIVFVFFSKLREYFVLNFHFELVLSIKIENKIKYSWRAFGQKGESVHRDMQRKYYEDWKEYMKNKN